MRNYHSDSCFFFFTMHSVNAAHTLHYSLVIICTTALNTPHPFPFWVRRQALWEGSGAVSWEAAKPDADVLFSPAGRPRSPGLSRYICSGPLPPTLWSLDQLRLLNKSKHLFKRNEKRMKESQYNKLSHAWGAVKPKGLISKKNI